MDSLRLAKMVPGVTENWQPHFGQHLTAVFGKPDCLDGFESLFLGVPHDLGK